MRGVVGLTILALVGLSLGWTSWKSRRALRKSLGRDVRAGEDTSLRTWMSLPAESLGLQGRYGSRGRITLRH